MTSSVFRGKDVGVMTGLISADMTFYLEIIFANFCNVSCIVLLQKLFM